MKLAEPWGGLWAFYLHQLCPAAHIINCRELEYHVENRELNHHCTLQPAILGGVGEGQILECKGTSRWCFHWRCPFFLQAQIAILTPSVMAMGGRTCKLMRSWVWGPLSTISYPHKTDPRKILVPFYPMRTMWRHLSLIQRPHQTLTLLASWSSATQSPVLWGYGENSIDKMS